MHAISAVFLSAFALGGTPPGELLDFTAKWCGPCQQMAPVIDRLARQGYPVRKVDIDQHRDLARQYGIQSIPAFVLVVNGQVVDRASGIQSESRLMQMLGRIPKPVPEFDNTKSPAPLFVENRASSSSGTVTMVTGQTASSKSVLAPNALVRTASAVQTKPQSAPKRGILGLNLLGRASQPEPATKKVAPSVVRANLDDQPSWEDDILAENPLAASTRLRISDKEGINVGTGTIIESKVGRTLILTCGHIFRNIQRDSVIEVDVFTNGKVETFVGKAIKHDLEIDLGVISIPTDNPLPFASLAKADRKPKSGSAVESVGCGQGNDPTVQKHVVTRINRYQGPENIECTGVPIQGRSGGGLFNTSGELVGVCIAADDKEHRGLYVGLGAVQDFLKQCSLQRLLPNTPEEELPELEADPNILLVDSAAEVKSRRGLAALQAALDEDDTNEVVCLVRSDRKSQSGQRVVILSGKPAMRQASMTK